MDPKIFEHLRNDFFAPDENITNPQNQIAQLVGNVTIYLSQIEKRLIEIEHALTDFAQRP